MTTPEAITVCQALIMVLQPFNPTRRFAYTATGSAVGVWNDEFACYLPYADLTLFGTWVEDHGCLVNGHPIPRTWVPMPSPVPCPPEEVLP